jgi:hypothetical protein
MTYRDTLAPGQIAAYDGFINAIVLLMEGDPMNNLLADHTVRDYCCAYCYGQLVELADEDGGYQVVCLNCGDGAGFVTKTYAARRRTESVGEAVEVKHMLQEVGVLPLPEKKTQAQLLKELGF